jgi:hypothetical protein
VLLATKTTFFQDIWNASWGWIKRTAMDVWQWLTVTAPAAIEAAFKRIGDFIFAPFKWAFNEVDKAWNNTIGRLSWTVPNWVPIIGGNTISAPRLPVMHSGGIVPGVFGREVPILARAGEQVLTAEQAAVGGGGTQVRVFIGERELTDIVRTEVVESGRSTRRAVLAGAGAR